MAAAAERGGEVRVDGFGRAAGRAPPPRPGSRCPRRTRASPRPSAPRPAGRGRGRLHGRDRARRVVGVRALPEVRSPRSRPAVAARTATGSGVGSGAGGATGSAPRRRATGSGAGATGSGAAAGSGGATGSGAGGGTTGCGAAAGPHSGSAQAPGPTSWYSSSSTTGSSATTSRRALRRRALRRGAAAPPHSASPAWRTASAPPGFSCAATSTSDMWIGSVSSALVSVPVAVSFRSSSISSRSRSSARCRSPWISSVFSLSQPARPR